MWKDWESLLRAIYNIQLYLLCAFIRRTDGKSKILLAFFFFLQGGCGIWASHTILIYISYQDINDTLQAV